MIPVAFPNVEETVKRALDEVLAPFLSTGNSAVVGGVPVNFHRCLLHYNIEFVNQASAFPRICIVGTRGNPLPEWKCHDALGNVPLGYIRRETFQRSIYVSIPRSLVLGVPPYLDPALKVQANDQVADEIWSQFMAVILTQKRSFIDRNLYNLEVPATAAPAPDKEFLIRYAVLSGELRFAYARG